MEGKSDIWITYLNLFLKVSTGRDVLKVFHPFKIRKRIVLLSLFNMFRKIGVYIVMAVVSLFFLASCQERMVCPAYQSTYILDDSVRALFFSRFEPDSLPKRFGRVEVAQNGLVKKKSRQERLRIMRTVAMENVVPPKPEPDSVQDRIRSLEELNRVKEELEEPSSSVKQ